MTTDSDTVATPTGRELHRPSQALWQMTGKERVDAMWAGELTFAQLREWSSRRPQEVPMIGSEFAWIAMRTPEWAESSSATGTTETGKAR
jgi:hypothetical protein